MHILKEINEDIELLNQSYSHCAIPNPKRKIFFDRIEHEDFTKLVNELTKQKINQRIYYYARVCLKNIGINHFINKMKAKWKRK